MTAFIDTNVFVYQFDDRAQAKQQRARAIVRDALESGSAVCSSQVVNEFCNLALRRFSTPMTTRECGMYVDMVLSPLCTVGWSPSLVQDALRAAERWQLSWFDGLIVAAAIQSGSDTLYSEDLQNGMRFGSVKVKNPFL